jgi:hypothetical protein
MAFCKGGILSGIEQVLVDGVDSTQPVRRKENENRLAILSKTAVLDNRKPHDHSFTEEFN